MQCPGIVVPVRRGVLRVLLYLAEVRWCFTRSQYTLARGGTKLHLGAEKTLRPVTFVFLGLGVDHAR